MNFNRPNWEDYFLELAELISKRSPDSQTRCGCVLVDSKNRVLGHGYNGFPRGLKDDELPNTRPDKYPWMIHAEVNAILNSNGTIEGAAAYITTVPCFNCLILLWQAGVGSVVYSTKGEKPKMVDESHAELTKRFIDMSGMKLRSV